MATQQTPRTHFIYALAFSTLVSLGFFAYGAWRNHSFAYAYLVWNLFLAWLPLMFVAWLIRLLMDRRWSSWPGIGVSLLWLVFLPNSFYMISDFIHLDGVDRVDILYDAVMFTSFIFTGVLLGFASLYLVHLEFRRRMDGRQAAWWIAGTLLLCCFAIYVGRDLRWNSWDILTNPGGLLFDISDRFLHPSAYPEMFVTVIAFFALLGSMYTLVWRSIAVLRQSH